MGVPSILYYITGRLSPLRKSKASTKTPTGIVEPKISASTSEEEDFIPLVGSPECTKEQRRPETPKQRKNRKSRSLRRFLSSSRNKQSNRSMSFLGGRQNLDSGFHDQREINTTATVGWSVLKDDDEDTTAQDCMTLNDLDDDSSPQNLVTVSVAQWDPKQGIAFTYSI